MRVHYNVLKQRFYKTLYRMRIILIAIFIITGLAVSSCNQHTTIKSNPAVVLDSTAVKPNDTTASVPGMPGYIYKKGEIYPVGQQSFIDTFGIDGQHFRFMYTFNEDKFEDNAKLEQLLGDKWQPLFMMDYLSGRSNYSRSKDVNGDGYPDFLDNWRYGSHAYFYKPAQKTFDTAISLELLEWELLDTVHNIYCQNHNIVGHQEESILYTFDGLKQVILYTVDFDKDDESSDAVLKALNLYKSVPGYKDSSVLVSKVPLPKDETEFDYDTYWRKNYKELLGLK